ncbi:TSUP family transporter [Candidatus Woesearchaeota archaeon]|nr:TSUP family transporter [Candidatus Woesearchaeota archaeon]
MNYNCYAYSIAWFLCQVGATGFASSLIIVSLLSFFIDIKKTVPIMAILTVAGGLILFLITKKHIQIKEFILLAAFTFIGSFIGVKILSSFDSRILKQTYSIFIMLFSIKMLLQKKLKKN